MLDSYTDYLISSTKYTTATGLSRLFNNRFSHDKVTRFLNSQELDNKKLWSSIKPFLRSVEKDSSVLIVDDRILEKPYTDKSSRPKAITYALSDLEQSIAINLRRIIWWALDEITEAINPPEPEKIRSAVYRIFVRKGINRMPEKVKQTAKKFKEYTYLFSN